MSTITIDLRMWNSSGIGTYIRNVVPALIAQRPNWTFCFLGYLNELQGVTELQALNCRLIPVSHSIYSPQAQWELYRSIPTETDLYWSPHYTVPWLYPWGFRGATVVTIHDVFHLAMMNRASEWPKKVYAQIYFRQIARHAFRIMADSAFTKSEMLKYTDVPGERIQVIHLGIDPFWFSESKPPELGSGKAFGTSYFLFVGNVKPHKNLSGLIQAMARIKAEIPHRLVIVGKKDGFITGDPQVVQLGDSLLGDRIEFTGHIDDERLKNLYRGAEALVLPSFYEGFGFPPLEGMAAHCPAIISDRGSLPEICGDGSLVCNPDSPEDIAKKMLSLVRTPGLRTSLIEKGSLHVVQYQWKTTLNQILQVLENGLREPRS